MEYTYKTPEEAIISLELAYTNQDLEAIMSSKDFVAESLILLERATYDYDTSDTSIVEETAELLKLSLIQHLQENGFPNFENAKREFTEIHHLKDNIYYLEEILLYPDNTSFKNKVYLSNNDGLWKIVMIEE
ncbi:Uncharacterised protein [Sphingobacterium multivorum]|uniref:hypothetical protein n=1 Tax=Sphingobacterium multivorum TaxID=28454 RepID=UPI000DF87FB4|nr:hypothetical protein [Sphingobacterium multivorum]QQT46080.1 hypothetical protein I6J00_05275 [Sphingobacterium multivorum]SUJ30807.1 Uncharacterised protein [Sphingobacterium multivorum]